MSGVQDADGQTENANVTLTAAGLPALTINVTVTDDDTQAIFTSAARLDITEGMSGQVGNNLAVAPPGNLVVTVASSNPALATATPATLTFTPLNFGTPQQVTVTGVQDDDTAGGNATLTVSTAGVPNATVDINVTDDDVQAILPAQAGVTIAEGATAQVGVRLAFRPAANVTVAVASARSAPVVASRLERLLSAWREASSWF